MLLRGEIDAGMIGANPPADDRIRPLFNDVAVAERAWYERHKAVPINHMVVVRKEIVADRPDVVRELFRMLVRSRDLAGDTRIVNGIDLQPVGLENLRNALGLAVEYAFDQRLIRQKVTVDELFDEVTADLGTA
jgi:4,5-dihydroxyphthalate decarboxylase